MKVKLLNDGGYGDMQNVKFPVEVEASFGTSPGFVLVRSAELYRIGANYGKFDVLSRFAFLTDGHVELIK